MGAADHGDKELTDATKGASRAARIEAALRAALQPTTLEIIDDSSRHAGHAGAQPGGETHFTVRVTAQAFSGASRVARQRMVNDALHAEFATGLHALAMDLKAPGEG
ncbi:MAG: BolA/IbaG family iron-sulfur metabolism protein [Alphaproteobacteria bacterium]|nr:BolA/IbaG family iron-sulfur metabolism protein [Alphaproteobacteria bacterium]